MHRHQVRLPMPIPAGHLPGLPGLPGRVSGWSVVPHGHMSDWSVVPHGHMSSRSVVPHGHMSGWSVVRSCLTATAEEEEAAAGGQLLAAGMEATCPAGQVALGGQCMDCRKGHYCIGGVPVRCPDGSWLDRTGASNSSDCEACPPTGVRCVSGYTSDVLPGYYMPSRSSPKAYRCASQFACAGGELRFGEASCAEGHTGALCGGCKKDYYRGRRRCLSCAALRGSQYTELSAQQSTALFVPVLVVVSIMAILCYLQPPLACSRLLGRCWKCTCGVCRAVWCNLGRWRWHDSAHVWRRATALVRIVVSFSQCLGAVGRFTQVQWPDIFAVFLELLDMLTLELFSIIPAECALSARLGFYIELLATLLMPVCFVLGLMTLLGIHALVHDRWARCRGQEASRAKLRDALLHPRTFKLSQIALLFMYPSLARKSIAIFDCIPGGDNGLYLLRDEPIIECYTPEWIAWAGVAMVVGVVGYCLGLPLAAFLAARHHARGDEQDERAFKRVEMLVSAYKPSHWFAESLWMLHRFFFTGVIHVIYPSRREQIYFGMLASFVALLVHLHSMPYRHEMCNWAQAVSLLQLWFTYSTAMMYTVEDAASEYGSCSTAATRHDTVAEGVLLISVNCACFVFVVISVSNHIWRSRKRVNSQRLYSQRTGMPVVAGPLGKNLDYHLFLSHTWLSGQDQMRIVKQRLLEAVPNMQIFLDVDVKDMNIGLLERYIDASQAVLAFASEGYLQGYNCIRELRCAVQSGKPITLMLEPETKRGGLTIEQVSTQLRASPHVKSAEERAQLHDAIFAEPALEWNRLAAFQSVTINLIAQRVLCQDGRAMELYKRDDITQRKKLLNLRPPCKRKGKRFHLFVSEANAGALSLIEEDIKAFQEAIDYDGRTSDVHKQTSSIAESVFRRSAMRSARSIGASAGGDSGQGSSNDLAAAAKRRQGANLSSDGAIRSTTSLDDIDFCERMLLYLNKDTWADGPAKERLFRDVAYAIICRVPILCVHEMPGVGSQEERGGCIFDRFFDASATPQLLKDCIYKELAVPFRGGPWRHTSRMMLLEKLAAPVVDSALDTPAWKQGRSRLYRSLHEDGEFGDTASTPKKPPSMLSVARSVLLARRLLPQHGDDRNEFMSEVPPARPDVREDGSEATTANVEVVPTSEVDAEESESHQIYLALASGGGIGGGATTASVLAPATIHPSVKSMSRVSMPEPVPFPSPRLNDRGGLEPSVHSVAESDSAAIVKLRTARQPQDRSSCVEENQASAVAQHAEQVSKCPDGHQTARQKRRASILAAGGSNTRREISLTDRARCLETRSGFTEHPGRLPRQSVLLTEQRTRQQLGHSCIDLASGAAPISSVPRQATTTSSERADLHASMASISEGTDNRGQDEGVHQRFFV